MTATGVYTLPELSKLVGIKPDRGRRWFNGKGTKGGKRHVEPMFTPDYERRKDGATVLSFYNLIDALVASKFAQFGVPTKEIKRVYRFLSEVFNSKHAFCRKDLMTDGQSIFLRLEENSQQNLFQLPEMQGLFRVMVDCLHKVDYDENGFANRWRIAEGILIDPRYRFGQPMVENAKISADVLADAYFANGRNEELIASWYQTSPQEVLNAVKFCRQLAA
ncbi:MAG: hypothetical protein P1V97_30485 [Planctomycetota bacterium]|nr:hypothetical protein [Planctomycetota bacterium]